MQSSDEKKLTFGGFIQSLWWSFKIFWKISPGLTFVSVFFGSVISVIQVLNNYVFAKLIDVIISVSRGELSHDWVYYTVFIFFGFSLFRTILGTIEGFAQRTLQSYSYPRFQELLYIKLQSLGVSTLEQPEVNNLVARAQQNWRMVEMQVQQGTNVLGILVAVVTNGIILFFFAPPLIPLIILVSIPYVYIDSRYQRRIWREDKKITEERRAAYDSSGILQDPKMLQEVLITGGNKMLERRFGDFIEYWTGFLRRNRSSFYKKIILLRALRFSVEGYGYYVTIMRFLANRITVGDVTFYFRAVNSFASDIQSLSDYYSNMFEGSLRVGDIKELFEMEAISKDGKEVMPLLKLGPEIQLNSASFSYPNSKTEVIKNINLHIKSGEKIAIVGHNGAGKTTLVKLLCRFYGVSNGEILVNGTDINNMKIDSWYQNIGVLFQEYNTYPHLTAMENIVIGRPGKVSEKKLRRSAKRADADNFIQEFEKGFDQTLSERYKGGVRPSTGMWQKIAIARFFYRDAPLVIFDEPTAAIDAVSEKRIFDKIYKFFEGKTVIIISHRFSTVRNADRIIVFEKGQIVEQGTHEELMKLGGKYAQAFKLQAEGYKN